MFIDYLFSEINKRKIIFSLKYFFCCSFPFPWGLEYWKQRWQYWHRNVKGTFTTKGGDSVFYNLFYNLASFYRMPVQYIVGEWDFYNITLKMRPPVFIPRPETECLVEKALELLRGISTPKVLEIGCGSGAISLSLLKSIKDVSRNISRVMHL